MNAKTRQVRCAIYTRKSHEEGLDQEFNSLDAQRQAAESYIKSQVHEGWKALSDRYDDGGISGGTLDRPALNQLMEDVREGIIDCVVVYKVDRLSRSLLDFAKLIDLFDECDVTFVSVTQQFNTTTSMGRLTLNILLSFAQFEREIIGERIRDKKLATARQGKYIGGQPKMGLDIVDRKYVVNDKEAKIVRRMFNLSLKLQSCRKVAEAMNAEGIFMKKYRTKTGKDMGGQRWRTRTVYDLLTDKKYIGKIEHKGVAYDGQHDAIVDESVFQKVAEVLSSNKVVTHKHQSKRFALLRRMLRCGECGSLVQPVWTKNHGREYHYYVCSRRIKTGYAKCELPTLPAGEIESMVVDQLRSIFQNPEVVARTFREVATLAKDGPGADELARLDELRTRRKQVGQAIRSLLTLDDPESEFLQNELKDLHGQLKSLDDSIRQIETQPATEADLEAVTSALQRLDPIWEVLVPKEQRRVLELLIAVINVGKKSLKVQFRADGIEQIVTELEPIGERNGRTSAQ
ncbi:recombinase family protein [bacterium]|nr:recombinase family protein [bacterium]